MFNTKPIQRILLLSSLIFTSNTILAYEFHISLGANQHSVKHNTGDPLTDDMNPSDQAMSIGFGFKNQLTKKHYLGLGMDFSELLGQRLRGYRALDYQYALFPKFRVGGFFGAVSIDSGLPQSAYYMGINASAYKILNSKIALTFELSHGNGLSRDRLLDDDPQGEKPDIFLDYLASCVKVSWEF